MDAWGALIAGSTISAGDAWEHLNAQDGGSGGEVEIIVEAIRSADIVSVVSVSCETEILTANITSVASASVNDVICTADCADKYEATI